MFCSNYYKINLILICSFLIIILKLKFLNCNSISESDTSKTIDHSDDSSNFLELSDLTDHDIPHLKYGRRLKNLNPAIWDINQQILYLRRLRRQIRLQERRRRRLLRLQQRRLSVKIDSLLRYRLRLESGQGAPFNRRFNHEFPPRHRERRNRRKTTTSKPEDNDTYQDESIQIDDDYSYDYEN